MDDETKPEGLTEQPPAATEATAPVVKPAVKPGPPPAPPTQVDGHNVYVCRRYAAPRGEPS